MTDHTPDEALINVDIEFDLADARAVLEAVRDELDCAVIDADDRPLSASRLILMQAGIEQALGVVLLCQAHHAAYGGEE
jgi:hypothetical protein